MLEVRAYLSDMVLYGSKCEVVNMSPFKGNTIIFCGGVNEMINIDQILMHFWNIKGKKEILFMEIWETW